MIHRRRTIGLGFLGLFIMLLCAGSTLGSEAVGHNLKEPKRSTTRDDINSRIGVAKSGLPVSFPIVNPTVGNAENLGDLTYTNFSIAFCPVWIKSSFTGDKSVIVKISSISKESKHIICKRNRSTQAALKIII